MNDCLFWSVVCLKMRRKSQVKAKSYLHKVSNIVQHKTTP